MNEKEKFCFMSLEVFAFNPVYDVFFLREHRFKNIFPFI